MILLKKEKEKEDDILLINCIVLEYQIIKIMRMVLLKVNSHSEQPFKL